MPDLREESNESQNPGASNIAWFLTGALIGATAAVLSAAKKETMAKLAKFGGLFKDGAVHAQVTQKRAKNFMPTATCAGEPRKE